MKTFVATLSLASLAIFSGTVMGCANRLSPAHPGPVDPAGGGSGALPTTFVNPPYRAQDVVNVTGQTPLTKKGKVPSSAKAGSRGPSPQYYSK